MLRPALRRPFSDAADVFHGALTRRARGCRGGGAARAAGLAQFRARSPRPRGGARGYNVARQVTSPA